MSAANTVNSATFTTNTSIPPKTTTQQVVAEHQDPVELAKKLKASEAQVNRLRTLALTLTLTQSYPLTLTLTANLNPNSDPNANP